MKRLLLIVLVTLMYTGSLHAQKQKRYLTSKFISGCPVEMESIVKTFSKNTGLSDLSYSNLETGIDSIKVVFGKMSDGKQNGYWIATYINKRFTTFSSVNFLAKEKEKFPTKIEELTFEEGSKKISLQLLHNIVTNEVEYLWYNSKGEKSKVASMVKIDKPIGKNKLFPPMSMVNLNNESISVKDYIGKFVVINWWAINCEGCVVEMPGLNSLVEKYKSDPNVVFLAIADNQKKDLESFLAVKKFKYLQTVGGQEAVKLFGKTYPRNVIVNPQGIVSYYSEGGSIDKHHEIDNELQKQIGVK